MLFYVIICYSIAKEFQVQNSQHRPKTSACMSAQEQWKEICWYFWKGDGDSNFVGKINLITMLIECLWWRLVNLFSDEGIPPNLRYYSFVGDLEGCVAVIIS
jgi:hypothetical protein